MDGTTIIDFLITESALAVRHLSVLCDVLFLDVYTSNLRAISLYERVGFQVLSDQAVEDELEKAQYIVMGRRVSVAGMTR